MAVTQENDNGLTPSQDYLNDDNIRVYNYYLNKYKGLAQYNGFYFLKVPIQWSGIYVSLLKLMADQGIDMLKDCKSSCSGTGKKLIECWNIFNAACAAFEYGNLKEAKVLIEYIVAQMNSNYKTNFKKELYLTFNLDELDYKSVYLAGFDIDYILKYNNIVFKNFEDIYSYWEENINIDKILTVEDFYKWFGEEVIENNKNELSTIILRDAYNHFNIKDIISFINKNRPTSIDEQTYRTEKEIEEYLIRLKRYAMDITKVYLGNDIYDRFTTYVWHNDFLILSIPKEITNFKLWYYSNAIHNVILDSKHNIDQSIYKTDVNIFKTKGIKADSALINGTGSILETPGHSLNPENSDNNIGAYMYEQTLYVFANSNKNVLKNLKLLLDYDFNTLKTSFNELQ